jgi:HEAT repeat protein
MRRLALGVWLLSAIGCAWGSKNGVPWWGSKEDKAKAAADVEHYGPFAFQRIDLVKQLGADAAKGSADEQQKVATELAAMISKEQDPLVRKAIIKALGTIPNDSSTAVLAVGIKDPDAQVREQVCFAWGRRAEAAAKQGAGASPDPTKETALRILAGALSSDTNIDVRLAAARNLGRLKNDSRAISALGLALKDADPALQYFTVASLKEVSGKDFGSDVGRWEQYCDSVAPPPAAQPATVASRP